MSGFQACKLIVCMLLIELMRLDVVLCAGMLDLHWATHHKDDPRLRHSKKGSVQLDPVAGTLIVS